jgi:LacI family transcriptional regulator
MGQWAIEQLESQAPGRDRYPVTKLECALVERDSVAAHRRHHR